MHRDRIRFLVGGARQFDLDGAREVALGLPDILLQLDAAALFLKEQTDENATNLENRLEHR